MLRPNFLLFNIESRLSTMLEGGWIYENCERECSEGVSKKLKE